MGKLWQRLEDDVFSTNLKLTTNYKLQEVDWCKNKRTNDKTCFL